MMNWGQTSVLNHPPIPVNPPPRPRKRAPCEAGGHCNSGLWSGNMRRSEARQFFACSLDLEVIVGCLRFCTHVAHRRSQLRWWMPT